MPFASALSQHPLTTQATGEVIGQILESLGTGPDLAVVFVNPSHGGALEDVAGAIRSVLDPTVLLGCVGQSVIGTGVEVEEGPAISLWAARLGQARSIRFDAVDDLASLPGAGTGLQSDGVALRGAGSAQANEALIVVADPFSFDAEAFLGNLSQNWPELLVIGGNASAARGPGANRMVLDGSIHNTGAVGALVTTPGGIRPIVSQGCRPIGQPMTVTRSDGAIIYEMAGQAPLQRLLALARVDLAPSEVRTINEGGLHIGRVIDERQEVFSRGDFLVRNVIGADHDNGAIAVGAEIDVGSTVQFHLRDRATADEDLVTMLDGANADAALVFTCNGRGKNLFGRPNHDAEALAQALGPIPSAGFFAAGEFGPIGGVNFVHGFTASIALFTDQEGTTPGE